MNITKKLSIVFLIVISILSTAFLYKSNATEEYSGAFGNENAGFIYYERENHIMGEYSNEYDGFIFTTLNEDMRGRLIIESICQHSYDGGDYITLQDLYDFYDVLCCQKGTKLPSTNETYLKGENGDRLSVSFPYLNKNDEGMLIYNDPEQEEPFGSSKYTSLTLGFYNPEGDPIIAGPKEAYILAEMVKELEGSVFYYDVTTDANGNKVKYEGSLEGSEKFYVADEELYIVDKEYVATLPDGSNVKVEAVSDGNGGVIYKYKEGQYQNHYEKYEGKLTWNDSKLGSGGTYPSFECTNSSSNVNSGVVTGDNVVPAGTTIYVTGSSIVVKDGEEYYRATVEGNNSYIQIAWWTTVYPESIGNHVADTAFSQEADAFEAYILQAAGVTDRDDLKHRTETVVDEETGEEKQIENAFDITYEPTWITDGEFEHPTTVFEDDKQSILVGPFSIDYIEARAQFGGRPEVEFAGITGMEIYTDASDDPLEFDTDWELVYLDGERTEEESNNEDSPLIYPKSNEEFYIRLFDTENATQITNIKVKFRYMNAAGSWQKLKGKYFKATWTEQHRSWDVYGKEAQYDEDGNFTGYKQVYDHTEHRYWLKLTDLKEQDSQALALGIKGAKWYKTTELNRKVSINEGKVVIKKELVDADGNEIKPINNNDKFTFKVTVNGAINSSSEKLKVKAGDSVESRVYYWMDGEETPTYEVEEIKIPDGYELVSIENATGTLKRLGRDTVVVKATNKVNPNSGLINVIKVMEQTSLPGTTLVGQTFDFNVKISGTFIYNGEKFENTSKDVPITVVAGQNAESATPTTVGPVYWYGDTAPTYEVTENKKEGTQLISINPDTGKFVANQNKPITVTAINKQKVEKASIRIIKTLKGSSEFTREYVESLKFTFEIWVDKNLNNVREDEELETITLTTPTRKDDAGNWVWEGVSSEYVWLYGNNPKYEITEINVPEGTVFNSGESNVTGTLVSNKQDNYEVKNNIINDVTNPNNKKLKITKLIDDANLVNRDYKFLVVVKGVAFRYTHTDGTVYNCNSNQMLQIYDGGAIVLDANADYDYEKFITINAASTDGVNGTGTKETGTFTWYGDKAPNYIVKENLLGEDISSSVEPSEGTLAAGTTDTIQITAWNRSTSSKGGYIHIIKTLTDSEKYSTEYVKSLVFEFDIKVGYNLGSANEDVKYNGTVALEPKLVNNSWVWEYTSERYSWKADQEALEYIITEVNLPEGTAFESASGPEGSTVSGTSISGKLKESVSQEVLITTDNSFINKLTGPKTDELIIEKKVTHDSLNGKEFKFDVTLKGSFEYNGTPYTNTEFVVKDVVVKGGQKSEPIKVTWYGDVAPNYVVTEQDSDIAKQVSIQNGAGTFSYEEGTQVATFTTVVNEPKLVGGQLIITKNIDNGAQDKEFLFEVKIGNENTPSYIVSIKAGELYKSDMYKWYITEEAPRYWVREINPEDGSTSNLGYDWQTGQLTHEGNATVTVDYINTYEDHEGKFKIKKVVLDEKLIDTSKDAEFKITATVSGTFNITKDDGSVVGVNNGSRSFDITLKGGQTFTSPTITWWGKEVPTVTVDEYEIPFGWQNIGISNNGASLFEEEDLEIIVTNELPVYVTLDLTTKLGGSVWVDKPLNPDDKNTENSVENGIFDRGENSNDLAKEGVEVYVYKVVADGNGNVQERTLATIYKDLNNTEVSQPIITDATGRWDAPRVKIPTVTDEQKASGWKASYDIEFVYDGQTYEPTTFLATSGGDVSQFLNASTADKDKFANDSMAKDVPEIREALNNSLETIAGSNPIDGNGETIGTAIDSDGTESTLHYQSKDISGDVVRIDGNVSKIKSELVTTDENGIALDLFKATATTGTAGLTFPFYRDTQEWNGFRLYNQNTSITELGIEQRYWYEAVYNYCLNINLGLVERPDADLGAAKDLYSAKVTIKGDENKTDLYSYRFNSLSDIGADYYTRQLEDQAVTAEYTLGLYSTDYYYRAEMYQTNEANSEDIIYDKIINMEKNIANTNLDSDEMEVELKYRIVLYNESGSYTEVVKSLVDYYDASFDISNMKIEDKDGNAISYSINQEKCEDGVVAIRKYKENPSDAEYKQEKTTYNKLVIDNLDIELASGEYKELFITLKVDKATINGVHDTIIAGRKSNIAEIRSYTTKYADGTIAGKIDKDSAPDNANIRDYNYDGWYEDDTDSAPVLYLTVTDKLRTVTGQVWEDKTEDGSSIGNGIIDSEEAVINGLTTQLVEKITVKETIDGAEVEKDYDFIWPTNQALNCFGGKSLKDLTGFDSTIETATIADDSGNVIQGAYKFEGIPTGKYVVRFVYGNDKTQLDDTLDITFDPVAVNKDSGDIYSGNENILTANYDNDLEGETAAVYNGQDYKATIYQNGFATLDGNGYIANRYHDLANQGLADARVSDVRDSEARRLEVIAKSETITNTNGNVLATANSKSADHTELYREYYMFADTAILDLRLENPENNVTTISNIDCGLIERPETEVILDKQISSIKLITNDQRVIFNADYDISYKVTSRKDGTIISEVEDGKYLVANVTLKDSSIGTDVMQAINKFESKLPGEDNQGVQNFRFINVDDTILQGATVELNYQMTALNMSEVDYTSNEVENIFETSLANNTSQKVELANLAKIAKENAAQTNTALEVGKYLGTTYYTGEIRNDKVVTTRIRQIIDYVDNDAVFSALYNNTENQIWKTTNITELTGNGYDFERILDRVVLPAYSLVDKDGKSYIAEGKTNIILSTDTAGYTEGIGNSGFEAKLLPYENNQDAYKSQIALMVSKTVSAQDKDLTYDNLAEIVKIQNTVGRRDMLAVPGNANPTLGEFTASIEERDASATELVTFTPPTGIEAEVPMTTQILIVTLVALVIVAVGIVIIKKKVL